MPRDKRLWMTFPIDMHRHPKITRLPVTARWAFFEMNGEARMQDNDGIFPAVEAEHEWGKKILDQLVSSHPTRPLVTREGDEYRIRDYAEHQQTKADRDELTEKRAEAGKAGAAKRWASKAMATDSNVMASAKQPVAGGMANDGNPITESESESEIDNYSNTGSVSPVSDRARTAGLADRGITSIVNEINLRCDIEATNQEAVELGLHILGKSKTAPTQPAAYIRRAIESNPSEIDAWFRARRRTLKAVNS